MLIGTKVHEVIAYSAAHIADGKELTGPPEVEAVLVLSEHLLGQLKAASFDGDIFKVAGKESPCTLITDHKVTQKKIFDTIELQGKRNTVIGTLQVFTEGTAEGICGIVGMSMMQLSLCVVVICTANQ